MQGGLRKEETTHRQELKEPCESYSISPPLLRAMCVLPTSQIPYSPDADKHETRNPEFKCSKGISPFLRLVPKVLVNSPASLIRINAECRILKFPFPRGHLVFRSTVILADGRSSSRPFVPRDWDLLSFDFFRISSRGFAGFVLRIFLLHIKKTPGLSRGTRRREFS